MPGHPGMLARNGRTIKAILSERYRQEYKWGEQHYPDGTGPDIEPLQGTWPDTKAESLARKFTWFTDHKAEKHEASWRDILLEEIFEAVAESDQEKLKTELIQSAAVIFAWIEDMDGRTL